MQNLEDVIERCGTYKTHDDSTPRAFVNLPSPHTPRQPTQVDYILPSPAAFYPKDGPIGLFPPVLGQRAANWIDIFKLIRRPELCWIKCGLKTGLDDYGSVDELWRVYAQGETVFTSTGVQMGVKPPLRDVEAHFYSQWRTPPDVTQQQRKQIQKAWSRFREIPEWIAKSSDRRQVPPTVIIAELNEMLIDGGVGSLNQLSNKVAEMRKNSAAAASEYTAASSSSTSDSDLQSNSSVPTTQLGSAIVLSKEEEGH
ncbi:hypothetical protein R3P38DRAFT_3260916 [Favolaschia claudopus]|uniref:Transcription activator GCR1-like domain-containing protein n=1 Tax=Favolaschia claudopus TaxID=2862362 RepID=A0AAW0CQS6_9AGAR